MNIAKRKRQKNNMNVFFTSRIFYFKESGRFFIQYSKIHTAHHLTKTMTEARDTALERNIQNIWTSVLEYFFYTGIRLLIYATFYKINLLCQLSMLNV